MLLLLFCIKIEDEKRVIRSFLVLRGRRWINLAIRASFDSGGTDKDEAMVDGWY